MSAFDCEPEEKGDTEIAAMSAKMGPEMIKDIPEGVVIVASLRCGLVYWGEVEWVRDGIAMIGGNFGCFIPAAISLESCVKLTVFPGPHDDETQFQWSDRVRFPYS